MSNEKMREEFEKCWRECGDCEVDDIYSTNEYDVFKFAWQASRAALCVELPEFPDMETIADIDYAHEMPKNGWDEDSFSIWQKLQVAQRNKMQLFTYAKKLRSIIMSINSGNEK